MSRPDLGFEIRRYWRIQLNEIPEEERVDQSRSRRNIRSRSPQSEHRLSACLPIKKIRERRNRKPMPYGIANFDSFLTAQREGVSGRVRRTRAPFPVVERARRKALMKSSQLPELVEFSSEKFRQLKLTKICFVASVLPKFGSRVNGRRRASNCASSN